MVVKILYKLYKKEGLSREEFVDRWLKVVVPLSKLPEAAAIKKWVSNVVVSTQGEDPGYLVSGEIWFDNLKEMQDTLGSPVVKKAMAEQNMASKETLVIVEEYVFK